jgi:glycosyltransferase involved in cell wall biosynthesis
VRPEPNILIAQVGPYPPQKNGIGDYMFELSRALREVNPRVSTLALACRLPGAAVREPDVWRCWDPRSDWPGQLLRAVDEIKPAVVHIQHGMYMGHDGRTERLLEGLRARRIAGVVTLHGVWPASPVRRWPRRFHRALGRSADRVIIHQRAGSMDVLLGHGVPPDRIAIIPHGTIPAPAIDRSRARLELGLTEGRLAVFAGLIFPRKGLHIVIRAFRGVARDVPGARLLAVGRERMANPVDWVYRARLRGLARRGRTAGWLDFRPGHVSEEDLMSFIAAADVMVFPYLRSYGSASGILHRVLAAGRPLICSNVPTFGEVIDAWGGALPQLIVPPGNPASWRRALTGFFLSDDLQSAAAEASLNLGCASPWPAVAGEHLGLYRALLASAP